MSNKINIKNIIQLAIIDKLLFFFTDITNMGVCVLDKDFQRIKYAKPRCKFCERVSKTHWKKCQESDKRGCGLAKKYQRPYIYQCYAGLTEVAIPLYNQKEVIGYIISGQVTSGKKQIVNRQYLMKIRNPKEVTSLIHSVPVLDYRIIKDMSHILFMIINFILEKHMYLILENIENDKEHFNYKIERAKKYIDEKFFETIKLEDVAKYIGLSSCYFSKLFKKITKHDYQQYLILKRIEKAKELLADVEMKITEVAFNTGFNDSNYFSYLFKKIIGLSPREYREKVLRSVK